jgi:hypothetical protein
MNLSICYIKQNEDIIKLQSQTEICAAFVQEATRTIEFCLSLTILESVLLANVIWYRCKETGM